MKSLIKDGNFTSGRCCHFPPQPFQQKSMCILVPWALRMALRSISLLGPAVRGVSWAKFNPKVPPQEEPPENSRNCHRIWAVNTGWDSLGICSNPLCFYFDSAVFLLTNHFPFSPCFPRGRRRRDILEAGKVPLIPAWFLNSQTLNPSRIPHRDSPNPPTGQDVPQVTGLSFLKV